MEKMIKEDENCLGKKNKIHEEKEVIYLAPGLSEYVIYIGIQNALFVGYMLLFLYDRKVDAAFWLAVFGLGTGVITYWLTYCIIWVMNHTIVKHFQATKTRMLNPEEIISCTLVNVLLILGVIGTAWYQDFNSSNGHYYSVLIWTMIGLWVSSLGWWDYSKGSIIKKLKSYFIAAKNSKELKWIIILFLAEFAVRIASLAITKKTACSDWVMIIGNAILVISGIILFWENHKTMIREKHKKDQIKFFGDILGIINKKRLGEIEKFFEIYDVVDKKSYLEVECTIALLKMHCKDNTRGDNTRDDNTDNNNIENEEPEKGLRATEKNFYKVFCGDSTQSKSRRNFLMEILEEAKVRKRGT